MEPVACFGLGVADSDLEVTRELLERSIYDRGPHHLIQLRTFTTATARLAGVLVRYEALCFEDAPPMARKQLSTWRG